MIAPDKYRLAERLGSGGMADVFRGEITGAEGFSRPVAIKRLHAAVSADPEFCAMFVREARLLAKLQHPNIVSVLDFEWDSEHRLFLVMELVDGVNLAQLARTGQLPVSAAMHVTAAVLRGLGHAHARGVLHRDVTPHNVLLAWTGEVKLGDFGLAKATSGSRVSDRGSIRGKVPYLSPEQLQGLVIDARSDLFSVGVMSYQLLTGRYPFFGRGDQPTMAESIARMLTATIVPPRDLRPEIPSGLSDVIMRLLDRDREHRYAAAEQVLDALEPYLEGKSSVAALLAERFPERAAGEPEAGLALAATPHASQAGAGRETASVRDHAPQVAARGRRWRRPALLLVAAVPLLFLVAGWWPLGEREETAGAPLAGAVDQRAAGAAGALLAHVDAGVAPADTEGQRAGAAAADDVPGPDSAFRAHGPAARRIPVHLSGSSLGNPGRHGAPAGSAGHLGPRSRRPRADADARAPAGAGANVSPGAESDTRSDMPPASGPATAGPATTRESGYERGWTEARPQSTITGEVPIRRTERR